MIDLLRELIDILLAFGVRWGKQMLFWLGFGIAVGFTTAYYVASRLTN